MPDQRVPSYAVPVQETTAPVPDYARPFEDTAAQPVQEGAGSRFFKGLATPITSLPATLSILSRLGPAGTPEQRVAAWKELTAGHRYALGRSAEAAQQGKPATAISYGALGLVPMAGPAAIDWIERAKQGDIAGPLAEATGAVLSAKIPGKVGGALKAGAKGMYRAALNLPERVPLSSCRSCRRRPTTVNVADITQIEPNIHAGVKYMRFMIDQYFKDEPMDQLNKGLFAFASYNAGPGRIRQLRREAEKRGLDPNVWFGNVEQIASERIGRETVTYVSNIYKYYVAYRLVMGERERRAAAKQQLESAATPAGQ